MPVILVSFVLSCSTDGSIQQILGRSVQAPVFLGCQPVSSTEISFRFSLPVSVVSLNFDLPLEIDHIEDGREVKIRFSRPLEEGIRLTADILVEDADRNSLNVIVPFRTRNDRMPALVINELRTEYSRPRVEFVELLALGPGNLGAIRLFIAGHSLTKPVYEFPPAEVKAGQYIVLNLRTLDEGSADGNGEFWIPGSSKLLHKTSALWLMDQDDRIIDAVLLCENPEEWGKNNTIAAAEFLELNGGWQGDAVRSGGTTATRTINRDEIPAPACRAENWYITVTSGASPGRPNNPGRYTP